jgi:hypothetical protein
MPKVSLIQQNFNGGEYSQGIKLRSDVQLYYVGGERYENFIPTKEGNLKFRTGFYYDRPTKSNNKTILIPFVSSATERYLLEFSDLVLRVFKDGVQVGTDIVSPYREEDLFNLQYAQEKTFMYLVDSVHPPYKLTSGTTFTLALELFDYEADTSPPFLSENLGATTITPSGTTGTITLTASASLFTDLDVGRYVKIRNAGAGTFGFARITVYTSDTVVTAVVTKTLPSAAAYDTWTLSMLPSAVAFFEQRLVYGQLNKIVFSKTPDDDGIVRYNDFTLGTALDDALQYESGLLKGRIQWMMANQEMLAIGTYTGIFRADSGELNESISYENPPSVKQVSGEGTINIAPLQKDGIVFFVSRDQRRILSLQYSYENDGYIVKDNMLVSNEMGIGKITQIALRIGDENILYATKENGEVIGMVFNISQQVNGWFRIITNGIVESVMCIPDSNNRDKLYISVARTVNSSTVRYIEYLTKDVLLSKRLDYYTGNKETDEENFLFARWEEQKDWNYLDSSLVYDGSDQSVTMTPDAITGSDITFTAGGALFSASDVGREIWEKSGTGRATIISYTSATEVQCNITSDFASTSTLAAGNWYFTSATLTGLSHLEGETVSVIRDGGRETPTYTVSGGEITISQQTSKATVGLPYTGLFKSMPLVGGAADGDSHAKAKLIDKMGIYFLNTVGAKFGTDVYNLNQVLFGPGGIVGRPINAYTGFKKLDLPERYEEEKHVYIIQDTPLCCIVQAIIPLMEANSE